MVIGSNSSGDENNNNKNTPSPKLQGNKNGSAVDLTDENPSGNVTANEDEGVVMTSLNNMENKFFKINRQIRKMQDQQEKQLAQSK